MTYEDPLLQEYKRNKQIADNELAVSTHKFLYNKEEVEIVIWHLGKQRYLKKGCTNA